jgi:hypothetical protein
VGLWDGVHVGVPAVLIRRLVPLSVKILGRSEPPDISAGLVCLATVPDMLNYIDERVDAGIIGGDHLNAGDFHVGMVGRLLMSLTDLLPIVRERAAERIASRAYPTPIPRVAPFLTPEQMSLVQHPDRAPGDDRSV